MTDTPRNGLSLGVEAEYVFLLSAWMRCDNAPHLTDLDRLRSKMTLVRDVIKAMLELLARSDNVAAIMLS